MREAKTYRSARRNLTNKHGKRQLNPLFHKVAGDSWTKDFPTTKQDKQGNQVPFITYVGGESRGKTYPYGSTRQGYDLPIIGG